MTKHSKHGLRTREPLRLSPKERADIDVVKEAIGVNDRPTAIRIVFDKLADLLSGIDGKDRR